VTLYGRNEQYSKYLIVTITSMCACKDAAFVFDNNGSLKIRSVTPPKITNQLRNNAVNSKQWLFNV